MLRCRQANLAANALQAAGTDDGMLCRIETGHFQVDHPKQVALKAATAGAVDRPASLSSRYMPLSTEPPKPNGGMTILKNKKYFTWLASNCLVANVL